jgi:hypothetical protein
MVTSNEKFNYIGSSNWTTVTCPMQRAFSSGTELPIKVGDTFNYKSGFRVYATASSLAPIASGQSTVGNYTIIDAANCLIASGVAAAIVSLMF